MTKLKIQYPQLEAYASSTKNMSSRTADIHNRLNSLHGNIDWIIRNDSNIDRRLQKLVRETDGYAQRLSAMANFLANALQEYRACETGIVQGEDQLTDNGVSGTNQTLPYTDLLFVTTSYGIADGIRNLFAFINNPNAMKVVWGGQINEMFRDAFTVAQWGSYDDSELQRWASTIGDNYYQTFVTEKTDRYKQIWNESLAEMQESIDTENQGLYGEVAKEMFGFSCLSGFAKELHRLEIGAKFTAKVAGETSFGVMSDIAKANLRSLFDLWGGSQYKAVGDTVVEFANFGDNMIKVATNEKMINRAIDVVGKLNDHGKSALNLVPAWGDVYNKNAQEMTLTLARDVVGNLQNIYGNMMSFCNQSK